MFIRGSKKLSGFARKKTGTHVLPFPKNFPLPNFRGNAYFSVLIMSDNNEQPRQQTISLPAIAQNFFGTLQRHFDLLAFNLAATQSVDAEKYNHFSSLTKMMPVAQLHRNFDQMKSFAHGLMLRQSVNDLLSMVAACMDNCHLLCTLFANKKAMEADPKSANELVGRKQEAFVNSALQDKFEVFEKEFGILCELEDGITNMAIALRSLMQNNGVVTAEDVDDDGELVFEFKTVQTIQPAKEGERPEVRLADTRRAFKAGDTIDLTNSELLSLNTTVAAFFDALFKSVAAFGKKTMGGNEGEKADA